MFWDVLVREGPLMAVRRLVAIVLGAALAALVFAGPAWAAEEDEDGTAPLHRELPALEEVVRSETSRDLLPERYEPPALFQQLGFPMLVFAGLVVLAVLVLYLAWQPRFARERAEKRRR
jgi:hypothetical protein